MKPDIPSQKKAYDALYLRLLKYTTQIKSIIDKLSDSVSNATDGINYEGKEEFSFDDYPELSRSVNGLMSDYAAQMNNLIYSGTSKEWEESNVIQDLLVKKVLKAYDVESHGKRRKTYYQSNTEALKAFQERVSNGMNLSQRLWNHSMEMKKELEMAISTAIERGQSSVILSKRISKYLNDFPSLKNDYTERFGKAVCCRDCQYAAIRLARTEINMAYRKAEQIRWNQLDFVLGYEVKLSKRHPAPDICDDLKGIYPKDFVFLGWHPNCMCYVIPLVMTDEQYYREESERNTLYVNDVPTNYKEYMIANEERIDKMKNLPYFVQDNERYRYFK